MKNFLAIYLGSENSPAPAKWDSLSEEVRQTKTQEGIQAWINWGAKYKDQIIDQGSPLGSTLKVDSKGVSDITNLMTGYAIVQAESHEAAAELFKGHPHFSIFPGDSIEIMECLPLPEM